MNKNRIFIALFFILTSHCASLFEEYDEKLLQNKEFDDSLKIQEIQPKQEDNEKNQPSGLAVKAQTQKKQQTKLPAPELKITKQKSSGGLKAVEQPASKAAQHQPSIEDAEGFSGRRPIVDPFVENEELTYAVSYFAVEAGRFTMKTNPFVQVNGRKSYHFSLHARSSSVFSVFYAVDDVAESFLDYQDLIPYSYTIKAKESKQVRDVKSFFNWNTMKAKTWDKKIKKGKEPEEKIYDWDILPYSQNVFTVAYYMRCFQYKVGKELSVRVAHEGKNMVMTAKVLREEQLKTNAGVFDTFVIKPEFEIDGVFKPVGDVFMWITKDSHHRIARIESKIKIGKIVVNLQQISP
jgi:hypothetical protein